MKKILFAILLSFSSFSFAQTTKNIKLECYPLKDVVLELNKFNEAPLLLANSFRSEIERNVLIIFMNTETRTWTILEKYTEEIYCILAMGDQLTPNFKK